MSDSYTCVYCDKVDSDCKCSKCLQCGIVTNGSQFHRTCYKMEIKEDVCEELSLYCDEEMPFSPAAEVEVRDDTPLSARTECDTEYSLAEDFEDDGDSERIDSYIHRMATCSTSIDVVGEELAKVFPNTDFTDPNFHNITLHKYITSSITYTEFLFMCNQWQDSYLVYKDRLARMVKLVYYRKSGDHNTIWCNACIDEESPTYKMCGFTKAKITVDVKENYQDICELIRTVPELFFCAKCEHFIFYEIEHFEEDFTQFESALSNKITTCFLENTGSYVTCDVERLICIVYPQVRTRRLCALQDFYESQ